MKAGVWWFYIHVMNLPTLSDPKKRGQKYKQSIALCGAPI
jgi:hypothetical protein